MICACFNDLGQYSRRIMALSMYMRFSSPSCGNSLSILAVMRSISGAFLWFNFVFLNLVCLDLGWNHVLCTWNERLVHHSGTGLENRKLRRDRVVL